MAVLWDSRSVCLLSCRGPADVLLGFRCCNVVCRWSFCVCRCVCLLTMRFWFFLGVRSALAVRAVWMLVLLLRVRGTALVAGYWVFLSLQMGLVALVDALSCGRKFFRMLRLSVLVCAGSVAVGICFVCSLLVWTDWWLRSSWFVCALCSFLYGSSVRPVSTVLYWRACRALTCVSRGACVFLLRVWF